MMFGSSTALIGALLSVIDFAGAVAVRSHTAAHSPARTFAECQKKTANPLQGCPEGTVYVSANDTRADFTKIQDAIIAIGNDTEPHYILIGAGFYYEQLNVTRSGPLYLLGQSDLPSKHKAYAAGVSYNTTASNDVQVWFNKANTGNDLLPDNVYTGVLTIGPTLDATLSGSGPTGFPVPENTPFGSVDFRAYNIDFRNEYAPYSDGPAHALGVSRANSGFYGCGFYSWQDTIYVGKLGNAYFYDTVVAGQTDFLYGFGTLYITKSALSLRHCGGGITAWKGTNTTFENKYGVYIDSSQVQANNYSAAAAVVGKCALGRPWNSLQKSVFMDSYFDASILPAGYIDWSTTDPRVNNYTFMATWDNYGPGWNVSAERASNVTRVLDDDEVEPYRWPVDVFLTSTGEPANIWWIDQSVLVPF
ncbi:Putative pectinesterase 11 [Cytospora mali]|uniref:pectinesterase n=1 Tax=Cytospora mali TaxID=578113 RepID=A0A194V108_CYTMA|nr:Putative pectinesterase 11 [Valsa mali var. pyri (nom. inval.)]